MKVTDLKRGDIVMLGGEAAEVKHVGSGTRPDQVVVEAHFLESDQVRNIPLWKGAELAPGAEQVELDFNSIMKMFEDGLRGQLKKGYERYGKTTFNPKKNDPLQYALEEAIDLVVYLYVAIEERKRDTEKF